MKLITKDKRIAEAVALASDYLNSQDFKKDVVSVEKFDNANVLPFEILNIFEQFNIQNKPVEIKCTYFGFFHRRVLGKTVGDGYAYVNSWGLDRQIWSIAATIVHEASHVVNEYFPKASFGHGSNSSVGKGKTFPYFIDERAENWIKREVLKKESNRLTMRIALLREVIA